MKFGRYRYPTAPLLATFTNLTASEVAVKFGVNRTTVIRWRNPKTTLNQWDADRYAIMLGKHPGEIWPDWFDID